MVKSQVTATISSNTFINWQDFCKENCINSSQLIEKLMDSYLKKSKWKMRKK